MDELLSTNPIAKAEAAFAAGDRRHIVVPVCKGQPGGEVIPGWPLEDSVAVQDAIKNGQRPIACASLGDDPDSHNFRRIADYARQYNNRMRELEKRAEKK